MQLIPATARRFGVKNTFDPRENVEGGVRYLKFLKDAFQRRTVGAGRLQCRGTCRGEVRLDSADRETRDYVRKVGKWYSEARKVSAAAPSVSQPSVAAPEQPQLSSD
jgi:hypothetical protein